LGFRLLKFHLIIGQRGAGPSFLLNGGGGVCSGPLPYIEKREKRRDSIDQFFSLRDEIPGFTQRLDLLLETEEKKVCEEFPKFVEEGSNGALAGWGDSKKKKTDDRRAVGS